MQSTLATKDIWTKFTFLGWRRLVAHGVVSMLLGLGAVQRVSAANTTGTVVYAPISQPIQGNQPLVPGSAAVPNNPYTLSVQAPNTGAPTVTYPYTLTLTVSVITDPVLGPSRPPGVSDADALSFVSLSTYTLTFDRPGQTLSTVVSVLVPLGNYAGNYAWKVKGNWPAAILDNGATINATVLPPISNPTVPPVVTIANPHDGQIFIYDPAGPALTVPIDYTATIASGTGSVDTLLVTFDNEPLIVYNPGSTDILTALSNALGLGTQNAAGRSWKTGLTDSGPHTITVEAHAGILFDTKSVTINVQTPARIVTNPSDLTVFVGDPASFAVIAKGTPAPTYQWQKEGVDIPGATSATLTLPAAALTDGGNYRVVVSNTTGDGVTHTVTSNNAVLTVLPHPQTITFNALPAKTYGDATFTLGATASAGLPVSYVSSNPAVATVSGNVVTVLSAGTTTFTASQAGNASYLAAPSVSQPLVVNKAPLTVAAASASRLYGSANPTFSIGYSGFVNGDGVSALTAVPTASTVATNLSSAGAYPITPSGGAAANYSFVYVSGTLTVGKAPLTVTAANATRAYGVANPAFTVAYTGFANGDTAASLTTPATAGTTATSASPVGTYAITASGGSSGNYSFTYVAGTLTVTKAALTVTANNQSRVYNTANPTLTLAYAGFVGGDSATSLTTQPTATTTAVTTSNVGTYPITVSGGSAANYTLSYVAGTLTVTKANQTITFGALAAKNVGDPAFTLTATASSGLAVSYVSSSTTVATINGSTVTIVSAGSTTITATQAGNGNYNAATSVSQTLVVQTVAPPPSSTCGTAIVRHAPVMNGNAGVDGSLQLLLPENTALNGNAWISDSFFIPGKPAIVSNGHPNIGSIVDGTGSATPTNYTITLNGNPVIKHIVRRTNATTIPVIPTPPTAAGTRDVKVNKSGDSIGTSSTIRDLTANGNAGSVVVPPGTYRDLTATGSSGFTLGVAGATQPAVYYVRNLTLNGNGNLVIVGPVVLTVTDDVTFNGDVGNCSHPEWLTLNLYSGDLTINGSSHLYGYALAPFGTATLNGNGTLRGGLICDTLRLDGNGLVDLCKCSDSDHRDSNCDNDHHDGNGNDGNCGHNNDDDDHHDGNGNDGNCDHNNDDNDHHDSGDCDNGHHS